MTKEDFTNEMKNIVALDDGYINEIPHQLGDELMCKALSELGYNDGVELFKNLNKCYA